MCSKQPLLLTASDINNSHNACPPHRTDDVQQAGQSLTVTTESGGRVAVVVVVPTRAAGCCTVQKESSRAPCASVGCCSSHCRSCRYSAVLQCIDSGSGATGCWMWNMSTAATTVKLIFTRFVSYLSYVDIQTLYMIHKHNMLLFPAMVN